MLNNLAFEKDWGGGTWIGGYSYMYMYLEAVAYVAPVFGPGTPSVVSHRLSNASALFDMKMAVLSQR